MSEGQVNHVGCGGRFDVDWNEGYVCRVCKRRWDGKENGVAEYVETK